MANDIEEARHKAETLRMTNAIIDMCNETSHPANVFTALSIAVAHALDAYDMSTEVFVARVDARREEARHGR